MAKRVIYVNPVLGAMIDEKKVNPTLALLFGYSVYRVCLKSKLYISRGFVGRVATQIKECLDNRIEEIKKAIIEDILEVGTKLAKHGEKEDSESSS